MKRLALVGMMLFAPMLVLAAGLAADTSDGKPPVAPRMLRENRAPTDPTWAALDKSAWVAEGNPKASHIVYVFTDTECKYCRKLWQAMQPYLDKGQLQTRHVMVAVIAPDSAGRGAAVMNSANPSAALKANEESKEPRLPVLTAIPHSTLEKLNDNETLMHKLGAQGTPAIVYLDSDGSAKMAQGVPPPEVLAEIFAGATRH